MTYEEKKVSLNIEENNYIYSYIYTNFMYNYIKKYSRVRKLHVCEMEQLEHIKNTQSCFLL